MKRAILSLATVAAAGLLLAACGGPAAAPAATTAPAKPAATTAPAAAGATMAPAATKPAAPAATAAPAAAKSSFPEKGKPITIVVPVNAGGGSDVSTRLMLPAMEKILGTQVQVVNKPGAGQQLGHTDFAKSKPDGYTLDMTNLPTTLTTYLDKERQAIYNRKTFMTIAAPVMDPGAIFVKADSPYKTLKDLVEAAKAKPSTIKGSTTGILSAPHLELLQTEKATGAKFATVHFDGAAPATTALLGGHIDVQFAFIGDMGSQIKGGEIRAISVLDDQESPYLPGIKTAKSEGYNVTSLVPRGYSAVAGTPADVVAVLEDAFKKTSEDAEVKKKQDEMFLTQKFLGSKAYGEFWDKMEVELTPLVEQAKLDAAQK